MKTIEHLQGATAVLKNESLTIAPEAVSFSHRSEARSMPVSGGELAQLGDSTDWIRDDQGESLRSLRVAIVDALDLTWQNPSVSNHFERFLKLLCMRLLVQTLIS